MAPETRRQIVLAGLAVVLAVVIYQAWSSTSAAPEPSSNGAVADAGRGAAGSSRRPAGPVAPDVHLNALSLQRPKPVGGDRNLFRFNSPRPRPSTGPSPASTGPLLPVAPPGPVVPAGPPAITLKFVGLVERREQSQRIAVLRDTVGHIFYGGEGAIIEGRYRIVRIGAESIEVSYLDGQGRQTIRMTGG
jgi:hypothetical protein